MALKHVLPRRRDRLPWTGGALAALLAAAPALAATHTITSGTVVYPGMPYGANDVFVVSGASTVLEIQSGSLPLTSMVDLHDGATVDNAGSITRTGTGNRGVVGGNGHVINRATGIITADGATGVLLYEGGSVLNDGGLISGTVYGISLQGDTGEVTNKNGGTISGDVMVWEGGEVTNTGADTLITGGISVLGTGGTVTNSDGATISASGRGVHIRGGGMLTNTGEGSIIEAGSAVHMEDGGEVENGAGAIIRGGSDGIYAGAPTVVTNNGTIEVTAGSGVDVAGGTVTNSGVDASITASATGVFIDGEGEVINVDGALIEASADGVIMNWGGNVTNKGGSTIAAGSAGVVVWDFGEVLNTGTGSLISGDGVGVDFSPYTMTGPFLMRNEDGAEVDGGYAGVRIWGDGSETAHAGGRVENRGTGSAITANSYGVFFEEGATGDVLNEDGALIQSRDGSGVVFYAGGDITNRDGAQIDAKVVGVYALAAPTSVTNTGTGSLIRGKAQAIYINGEAGGTGTIVNSDGATIAGGGDSDGGMGVWIAGEGSVTNDAATITGDRATGAHISDAGTVINRNGGTIEGSKAVYIGGDGTVSNTGRSSMGAVGIGGDGDITNAASAIGRIDVEGRAIISNTAKATIAGITAQTADITNDGATISVPPADYGVVLGQGGKVSNINGGRIEGGPIAIYLAAGGGTVTNGAGSTIASTSTGIHAFGDTTVVNAGTIEGNVWLEAAASNSVTLMTGSRITGDLHVGNNSTSRLILDGSGTQLYSDAVTNDTVFAATVVKQGTGSWTIDRHIDATVFNIDDGTLILGSAIRRGSVAATVYANPGTVVKGAGTIYGNLITDGATISPGNSPGDLTIVGGYLQDAATTYRLEFDRDADVTDRIVVSRSGPAAADGNAILLPGATLDVTQLGTGPVRLGTRHAVLSAGNLLSGTFTLTGDVAISPFLALEDQYDAHNAYLAVVQARSVAEAATTPNQTAIAEALETATPGNAALVALLSLPDDASAASALEQLTGAIHATARDGLVDAARPLREAALGRLRETLREPGATLWTSGYGLADSGLDITTAGFLFGADLPGPGDMRLGIFGGTGRTAMGTTASSDFALGAYGGAALGDMALRGGATASVHSVRSQRRVAFGGYADTLAGFYGALTTQGFLEAGYRVEVGPVGIQPFAGLTYVGLGTSGFTETGGDAALTVAAGRTGALSAALGLAVDADLGPGTFRASAGWQQRIAGDASLAALGFAGGETRTVHATSRAAGGLALGVDLDMALGNAATLSLGYDGLLSSDSTQHSARAELRVAF